MEERVFQKRSILTDRLLPFGFTKTEAGSRYERPIADGDFLAVIDVDETGKLTGTVLDTATGEEYLPLRLAAPVGSYGASVREAYLDLLEEIAEAVSIPTPFQSPQSNRIAADILSRYGEAPDNPFQRLDDVGIFRCPNNRKWYGIIMSVEKRKITGEEKDEEVAEILNLKADPGTVPGLHECPGIYPAYHMNRKYWVSILLDSTVPDETILDLLDQSRRLVIGKRGPLERKEKISWLLPANPKFYDIEAAFDAEEEIRWKQSSSVAVGDTAYMYVGAPVSAVLYRCEITETDIPYEYQDENVSMTRLMRIRLLKKYPRTWCPFAKLKELGIRAVRGPRTAPAPFLEYMEQAPEVPKDSRE